MSIKRDITDFMFDIRDSIRDIRLFVQTMTYEEFTEDRKTINAVIRSLDVKLKTDDCRLPAIF